mmetsp:Transcript_628/g.744  ORF Transcript_628/g.744 Transcript_628/m.744 type:complete len:142 (-) Transcript_628:824-1249(-)
MSTVGGSYFKLLTSNNSVQFVTWNHQKFCFLGSQTNNNTFSYVRQKQQNMKVYFSRIFRAQKEKSCHTSPSLILRGLVSLVLLVPLLSTLLEVLVFPMRTVLLSMYSMEADRFLLSNEAPFPPPAELLVLARVCSVSSKEF